MKIQVSILLLALLLTACSPKSQAINDLESLRTELKEHSQDYTMEDWEKSFDRFNEICERLDSLDLSRDERAKVNKMKGEIAGYAMKSAGKMAGEAIENISEGITSFTEGLMDSLGNEE
jgi:PBP1b-binding outer membrane lipoprotein LpoB